MSTIAGTPRPPGPAPEPIVRITVDQHHFVISFFRAFVIDLARAASTIAA